MKKRPVVFYHRTDRKSAKAILAGGFKDSTDYYMTDTQLTGVWLSNIPLDVNEGAGGDVLLGHTVTLDKGELDYYLSITTPPR